MPIKISLTTPEPALPRTVYYNRLLDALRKNARFTENPAEADLLFPAEDTAFETNWPNYGKQASAFVRGTFDLSGHEGYLNRLAGLNARLCVVNMNPGLRLPQAFKGCMNVVVADISMSQWERSLNPRTIAMPAMPIVTPNSAVPEKTVTACFRGVLTHACRAEIVKLHDGTRFICEPVASVNPAVESKVTVPRDQEAYADVMARSVFAFVPRGDALFSYRLLEAMAFGCIPVVISDSWVLPFDRAVQWSNAAVCVPESLVQFLPEILSGFDARRIEQMRSHGAAEYAMRFKDFDAVVETLLLEVESMF